MLLCLVLAIIKLRRTDCVMLLSACPFLLCVCAGKCFGTIEVEDMTQEVSGENTTPPVNLGKMFDAVANCDGVDDSYQVCWMSAWVTCICMLPH